MASTRKSRNVSKRFAKVNDEWFDREGTDGNKSRVRKRKLSDMLGSQWSKEELERFYEAYRKYGKDWKKVAGAIRNRSSDMVEALYNMNRAYLSLPEGTAAAAGLIAMMTDHYNILVVSAEERRRAIEGSAEYTPQMIDDMENDELVEVFGPEKKKRCRAVSSSSSVKQVKAGQAAKAIAEENGGNQELRDKIDKIEVYIKGIENAVTQIVRSLPQLAAHDNLSARTEFASNSQSCQVPPVNLNTQFDAASERRQKVILQSGERKEVAKGYLATHTICHGRRVMEDERIVWVEEVLDPDAHIYDAPQDGHRLLGDVADGGFLIWLHSRLKYIQ